MKVKLKELNLKCGGKKCELLSRLKEYARDPKKTMQEFRVIHKRKDGDERKPKAYYQKLRDRLNDIAVKPYLGRAGMFANYEVNNNLVGTYLPLLPGHITLHVFKCFFYVFSGRLFF